MYDVVQLSCPFCEERFLLPLDVVLDEISHAKTRKVLEVAKQLHDKSGPFYDRWLAAMEAQGEPKRCSDCLSHHVNHTHFPENYCSFKSKVVHPAWFACEYISYYEG